MSTITEEVKTAIFEILQENNSLSRKIEVISRDKDIEILSRDKDKEILLRENDIERILKEKVILSKEIAALESDILKFIEANSELTPRSVIEYVENYGMSKHKIVKGNRSVKWELFLTNTNEGKDIVNCITKDIPL